LQDAQGRIFAGQDQGQVASVDPGLLQGLKGHVGHHARDPLRDGGGPIAVAGPAFGKGPEDDASALKGASQQAGELPPIINPLKSRSMLSERES
jgi:hypothetical protein